MSRTVKKYLPKWKLTKFYHDKIMIELGEKKAEVAQENTYSEEEILLLKEDFKEGRKPGTSTMADFYYDRHCISYEQYKIDKIQELKERELKRNDAEYHKR